MNGESLDVSLVPLGLLILGAYHLWLLRRLLKHPTTTAMGVNAINRRIWVQAMMQDPAKTGVLAVQSLRNNIMASTLMASTAIMLSSLVAVLMTGAGRGGGWPQGVLGQDGRAVYGDRSELGLAVRLFSILTCFLLAFLFQVQSVRYYSHASILINVPGRGPAKAGGITAEYVACVIGRGAWFWSLGLRPFYFSFPLFLWILGPVPMFLCCVAMVFLLYFLDLACDGGAMGDGGDYGGSPDGEGETLAARHAEC